MPPPQPQVPVLDSFRGLAAVGILLYHCWLLSGEPALGAGPVRDRRPPGDRRLSLSNARTP